MGDPLLTTLWNEFPLVDLTIIRVITFRRQGLLSCSEVYLIQLTALPSNQLIIFSIPLEHIDQHYEGKTTDLPHSDVVILPLTLLFTINYAILKDSNDKSFWHFSKPEIKD